MGIPSLPVQPICALDRGALLIDESAILPDNVQTDQSVKIGSLMAAGDREVPRQTPHSRCRG